MSDIRVHLDISGRVQGVNYRYAARNEANKLGLTGWVRNLSDGRVEAVVEGDEKMVDQFINWCYVGPPWAKVTKISVQKGVAKGEFPWFEIAY